MKKKITTEPTRPCPLRQGLFLVIEGIDGSGKSTQVELLARRLRRRGLQVVTLREPTQGKWGRRIRELSKTSGSIRPEEELELFIRDRKENVARNIKPALEAGRTVILDRYFYSTLAYQGARGLPLEEIRRRHQKFALVPDLVFILDVPASTGLRRIKDRPIIYGHFEEKDYLQKVRKIFLSFRDPEVVVVDGRPPADVIHRKIWSLLLKKFPQLK
ncbi:MAG: dTMP kinase [Candidatus Saccharicenans sp.]|jgi:dTMP kinase|nr:dTMP kinase [Candidatus Saccharicenans sp.]MDH7493694.1 dTMP kinase [Candidatus Saccharicenans sp.]